ncbi:hypothetical protein [Geitlerinema sp. PCC 9228]|uniref:hypothetical protein n=1 Tax=Geitlerinema sp. PCC 9228 TaxID=111611 RepID=UPI0011147216|nr:hypothetical protein [Geitlerinema sp. PCC 9228]
MSLQKNQSLNISEPENRCPDCVFMKLIGEPIYSQGLLEKIDLKLTINFNEQWEELPAGRIKFGIRAGELRLTLENGRIPDENREWNDTFDLSISKERQTREAEKKKGSGKASAASGGELKAETTASSKNTAETTYKFQFSVAQVTMKGLGKTPGWVFEEKTGEQVLKGTISNQKLAAVAVNGKPCTIKATFEVSEHDIYVSGAEGVWPSDISRNKRAVIERLIVRNFLKSKIKPYISRQELQYE